MALISLAEVLEQDELDNIKVTVYEDSLDLVRDFFDKTDIKWGFCRFMKNGKSITPSELNSDLKLWMQRNDIDTSIHKSGYIKAALAAYDSEMYDQTVDDIKDKLKFDGSITDEFIALQQQSSLSNDDMLILKSWIWNVKRTLNGYETQQVPMPLLYSNQQRYGKSTFNQKLYEPVAELALRRDVGSITDKFGNGLWRKLIVVDFDEISSINNNMVSKFKEWCYADKISMRNPNTASMLQFEKVTSAIASSNVPVRDILKDSSGSRRIWQVNLTKSLFDALDNVDFVKLWQSVNENDECPLYVDGNIERITDIQFQTQRFCSPLETWLTEFKETNIKSEIAARDLFNAYDSWRKLNNEKRLSNTAFGMNIKALGLDSSRQKTGVFYYFD